MLLALKVAFKCFQMRKTGNSSAVNLSIRLAESHLQQFRNNSIILFVSGFAKSNLELNY